MNAPLPTNQHDRLLGAAPHVASIFFPILGPAVAVLVLLPLQMLSGGTTPRESMPEVVRTVMLAAPTTHFVELGQAILFRGAGIDVVWPQFAAAAAIGVVFFAIALSRFRKTIASMA